MSDEENILAQMEAAFGETDVEDVIIVSNLDSMELLSLFQEQKEILLALGEVLSPRTQEGRDAHSLYGACRIELSARGMM